MISVGAQKNTVFFRSSTPDGILNEFEGDLPIGYTNPFHLPWPYGIKEIPKRYLTWKITAVAVCETFYQLQKALTNLPQNIQFGVSKKNATFPMVLQVRKTGYASKISEPPTGTPTNLPTKPA